MSLEIVTATTELATTVIAVKQEAGLSTALTSDDAKIERQIRASQAWAESYIGYPLLAQRYRETLAAYGGRNLMVSRTPVRAVLALFYGTDTGDDATLVNTTEFGLEAAPGFLTRNQGWEWTVPVQQQLVPHPVPGEEFAPWLTEYVAGWTYDGVSTASSLWSTAKGTTSTGRSLPYDIEQAIIYKAASVARGVDNVVEKSVGDLKIKYGSAAGNAGGGVYDSAEALLGPYRRSA